MYFEHPLHKIVHNYDKLKLLVENGADLSFIDEKGNTVLHKAIWSEFNYEHNLHNGK